MSDKNEIAYFMRRRIEDRIMRKIEMRF